jgi:hypothetical protein
MLQVRWTAKSAKVESPAEKKVQFTRTLIVCHDLKVRQLLALHGL